MNKQWEYKTVWNCSESTLNTLGKDGWELINITNGTNSKNYHFFFKREVINKPINVDKLPTV